jgi:hypothetical protein
LAICSSAIANITRLNDGKAVTTDIADGQTESRPASGKEHCPPSCAACEVVSAHYLPAFFAGIGA